VLTSFAVRDELTNLTDIERTGQGLLRGMAGIATEELERAVRGAKLNG
jgi:hypothetical protein